MPAKDIYHDTVKNALIKDGWTITHDPLRLSIDDKNLFIDLGAERIIAAVKGTKKIAVEIKSFVGRSEVTIWKTRSGSLFCIKTSWKRKSRNANCF